MDDWVYSAEETEEGHKFASIKLRRKKLNCYNGCINRRTKYSVMVTILLCVSFFYFIVDVCLRTNFEKLTYSPFKEESEMEDTFGTSSRRNSHQQPFHFRYKCSHRKMNFTRVQTKQLKINIARL